MNARAERGSVFVYGSVTIIAVIVLGIILSVVLDSLATSWFGGWRHGVLCPMCRKTNLRLATHANLFLTGILA